ncbi:MAG: translation initiation factor IF-2 [Candidatus Margulisbacteria bacterium]|nr:translation initiation factor IF-2 [Candidatus Margulisiibacteriota bacterium]MBU1021656.1 translation initiation factor IF-2 [Candidatus Margulisiibacteriota bacterium]MBU1728806.1 translation initiation factor IF-2 [Candidatus Margulisiibacteriota bacterium]MBU1955772.1 translation initiation factor IF-2 [Candidatus Margulisiibacteriota bacterium]
MPKKVKVGSLAKTLKIEVKELLTLLKDLGVDAKTSASSVEADSAKLVKELVQEQQGKKKQAPKAPKEAAPKKKATKAIKKEEPVQVEEEAEEPQVEEVVEEAPAEPELKVIKIDTPQVILKDLSEKMEIKPSELIKELMRKGVMVTINQQIDASIIQQIAPDLGYKIEIEEKVKAKKDKSTEVVDETKLKTRPPVVVIMGHVDHGKTRLLDAIRKTNVIDTEAGGITQHIGAYQVEVHGKKVTFLDTPGHEAFTALRARGAKITDIAILVVAADDGVMPQTVEAIDHAKAAEIPIIVAINKIDKEGANPDRVKQQLSEHGLIPEDWAGKTVMVPISAKQETGIDDLLEMILLVADVQELRANPEGPARGVVIESKLDKGRGSVATVLINSGTLKVGDSIVIGSTYGRVRALLNDLGKKLSSAPPATPVEILGINAVPRAGEYLKVTKGDKEARLEAEKNQEAEGKKLKGKLFSLEDFSKQIKEGEKERKDLNLIVKADVDGSMEALAAALQGLSSQTIAIHIIHSGVGPITESDIMLAIASKSIVIGFHVGYEGAAKTIAIREGVDTRAYNIIYKVTEDIKAAMEGLYEPVYEEAVIGHARVTALFEFSKVGVIAGCYVEDGLLKRGAGLRQTRDGNIIYEGTIENLKRFKDDIKEVQKNFECGVSIKGYTNFKEGDRIECFEMRPKARRG